MVFDSCLAYAPGRTIPPTASIPPTLRVDKAGEGETASFQRPPQAARGGSSRLGEASPSVPFCIGSNGN